MFILHFRLPPPPLMERNLRAFMLRLPLNAAELRFELLSDFRAKGPIHPSPKGLGYVIITLNKGLKVRYNNKVDFNSRGTRKKLNSTILTGQRAVQRVANQYVLEMPITSCFFESLIKINYLSSVPLPPSPKIPYTP